MAPKRIPRIATCASERKCISKLDAPSACANWRQSGAISQATDASESEAKRRDFINRNCHLNWGRFISAPLSRKNEAQGFSSCD